MLALLDSLLTVGFDPVDQGMRYLAWSDDGAYTPEGEGKFDIGNATAVALGRIRRGIPAEEAGGDETTLGNGSLMRTLPLALAGHALAPTELVGRASRASAVTHASAIARTTCGLYALIAAEILRGQRDRGVALRVSTATLRNLLGGSELAALEQILAWPTRGGRGHVIDAFWSAWDSFEGAGSYRDTIARAVAYGQDTDTTACIAGGLAGAFWGFDGIPREWQSRLRDRLQVAAAADRLLEPHGWRTSSSHPLRLDTVDLSDVPGLATATGVLGMTFLPGKRGTGQTGPWWRDLDEDGDALRSTHGVDTLVVLVEDHELESCGVPDISERLPRDHGVGVLRHPVVDMGVPADPAAYRLVLADVLARVKAGQTVAIACRGGLGRTGTAVACLLVIAGLAPDDAIALTRRSRHDTIERNEQEAFVRAWD
jgi:ADP-ribosylglycohydrolase/protein-tyrosine phosphatase